MITRNPGDYVEKYIKVKVDSDDEFHLNKTIEIPTVAIVVRDIFIKNNKHNPQVFLEECFCKI